jgi:glycine C-acetyltransferase
MAGSGEALEFMREELERMKREGLYGNIRTLESPQGATVKIGGKEYLNFCSNN